MLFDVMSQRSAGATVVDLEAFRQRKRMRAELEAAAAPREAAVLLPVWFCWVPVWTPQMM